MNKTRGKRKILNYLAEYIIETLDELKNNHSGEFWAYIECLEILSFWTGFKKFGITDIEEYFNAK